MTIPVGVPNPCDEAETVVVNEIFCPKIDGFWDEDIVIVLG